MEAVTYTEARKNFSKTMQDVCQNHQPVIITTQKQSPVVMMSLEDYNSIKETMYLLSTPKNAARLAKSITEIENQKYSKKQLFLE
ncbi:MAG: type II toxin-antitoxin system prevent-host-death family antitoxin [bacterium]